MSGFAGSFKLEIKVLDPRLAEWGLPKYHSELAAAVDIHACIDTPWTIHPQEAPVLVPSGFAMHIADPHIAALLIPRSGSAHKRGLVLGNSVGLIDADYTAQVFVSAWNRNPSGDPIVIQPGERIAQMFFVPVLRPHYEIVEEFSATSGRGSGGFGSTGTGI
ncbi:aminotransferase [Devosia riboflavina]|uniref:dUTP diphosphatase n=1 Tax=Devosia riboflavina TaxID=46914 RepID=A0A087M675_9HYPH|nr:dUTP diphosphatase [Devosia riboflavina]KFL32378.1 aminotransferase [Devosia riboflavina]